MVRFHPLQLIQKAPMPDDLDKRNDPKELARVIRKTPETEKHLRQFLNVDGPKGNSTEFKKGWARMFGEPTGEHSGDRVRDAEGVMAKQCTDETCWCWKAGK